MPEEPCINKQEPQCYPLTAEGTAYCIRKPCRTGWFLCRCRTSPFWLYPFLCYDSRGDQKGRGYCKWRDPGCASGCNRSYDYRWSKEDRCYGTVWWEVRRKGTRCKDGRFLHRALRWYPCSKYKHHRILQDPFWGRYRSRRKTYWGSYLWRSDEALCRSWSRASRSS